jgi:KaiC/GvpD/RAD55 family RecA-like ATPase
MALSQADANEDFFRRGRAEWQAMGGHPAVKALDTSRARRVGQMLAPTEAPEFDEDPDELLDLQRLDGKSLLAEYEEEMACYATTPFDKHGERLRLYPCGVTIWSGFPGAGKTTLLRQLACHLLQREQGVFFASLEEHPKHLLVRLATTAAGTEKLTAHQMQWFIDSYGERLRIWAKVGLAKHRNILAVIRKLASMGTTHAIVDSLMKLDISSQDFEGQRVFANLLAATAQQTRMHVHLVAHPKKPPQADQDPDINDVGGAKEIGGIADNVLFIRRKEMETPTNLVSGMRICVRKQRHGLGTLGEITGYFHRDKRQFNLDQFAGPIRYLPEDAYT